MKSDARFEVAIVCFCLVATVGLVLLIHRDDRQNDRIQRLERTVRSLCTSGASSVAVRKLPSGRVVTIRPMTATGCVPLR